MRVVYEIEGALVTVHAISVTNIDNEYALIITDEFDEITVFLKDIKEVHYR